MRTRANGRIVFWEGASLWTLDAPPDERYPKTDPHAHHVIQITLALRGRVHFDCAGDHVEGVAIAIAPDVPHAFEATGLTAHLFVASDGAPGRAILRTCLSGASIAHIPAELLGDLPERLRTTFDSPVRSDEALRSVGRELVQRLAGEGIGPRFTDVRIAKLMGWVTARLDEATTLSDVAEHIGLSPGRVRHLFVQHIGLPFRTYLLWLRLNRAVELYAGGESLTEAAHGQGFADSAHLSRTFRRMFGIVAATLRVS